MFRIGLILLLALLWVPAAIAAPPAAPAPKPHHHTHRKTHHRHKRSTVTPPAIARAPALPPQTPAPVPNPDLLPPPDTAPPATSLSGGTLQMHYPHIGDGYVPGSSPSTLDDAHTPKVPGLTVKVPLTQGGIAPGGPR